MRECGDALLFDLDFQNNGQNNIDLYLLGMSHVPHGACAIAKNEVVNYANNRKGQEVNSYESGDCN